MMQHKLSIVRTAELKRLRKLEASVKMLAGDAAAADVLSIARSRARKRSADEQDLGEA